MIPTNDNFSSVQEVAESTRDVDDGGINSTATSAGDKTEAGTSPRAATRKDHNEAQTKEEDTALDILNDAALNNGDEGVVDADHNAGTSTYKYSGKALFESEKKRGIVARRTAQAVIHTNFTELRIQDLENHLRKMRIDLYKLPKDFDVGKEAAKEHPIFIHSLQSSTPDKFEIRREMLKMPFEDRPALEILVIENLVDSGTDSEPLQFHERATGQSNTHLVPKSLRIRPRLLIAHLQQVTRTHISNSLSPPNRAETAGFIPGEPEYEQDSIVFLRPFKLFVTYEEAIRQSLRGLEETAPGPTSQQAVPQLKNDQKNYENEDLLLDLRLLVKFMDEDLRTTFDLRHSIKEATATSIEYQDLWHLFKYGDLVVVQSDKSHAYRVLSFTGGRELLIERLHKDTPARPIPEGFIIDCLSISFDGFNYIPQLDTFSIRPFVGRQPITSLPIHPLKFDKDSESLKRDWTAQGRRYLNATIPPQSHKHLSGTTLDEPPHEIDAQVIIDMSMALSSVPEWRPQEDIINRDEFTAGDRRETHFPPCCYHDRYKEGCCRSDIAFKDLDMDDNNLNEFFRENQHILDPRTADELDDDDLMLLPRDIHGFVLRNRQWITLRTADLSEVRFENSFDDLMLPERHKSAIQALVSVHENAASKTNKGPTIGNSIDLVKGKGTGLILLLHGEPGQLLLRSPNDQLLIRTGVGKTSTAECVADHAKRPLFPITCGDIGETATEVEKNLHYNFRMAHKWGCVLLLDEADVFLAKRNKTDLRRNAVTSVFLRSLEYYAGILFLTTNRVGSIDPAFKSRIHMSLFYPKFDLEATLRLYSTYIKRARAEQERSTIATFKIKEKEILKFAKRQFRQAEKEGLGTWNGRYDLI